MARLLLLVVPLMVCSTDSSIRGDMEGALDDYYNYDEIYSQDCGGAYDNGLNPDCEPEPECDVAWCNNNCGRACDEDQICMEDPKCADECPCPVFKKKDLNISVSCNTSHSVMEFDLYRLFNLSLDTSQLAISISLQGEDGDSLALKQLENLSEDLSEGQVVLEAGVCNGVDLRLCMNISHPDIDPERHPPMCQSCTASGPPPAPIDVGLFREQSGITHLTVWWSPGEPQCEDTRYWVLLDDLKFDQPTRENDQKIGAAEKQILPGEYRVSVLAKNNHSESRAVALADNGGRYTIRSLTPPEPGSISSELEVIDSHLVANISWLCDLDSPEGGFNVTVTEPNEKTAYGFFRLLDWATKSILVRLDQSHPEATFTMRTYEESIKSDFSQPLDIFGSLEITAPREVVVTHSVSPSDQLTAELSWTNGVSVRGWTESLVTADITTEIEIWRTEPGTQPALRTGTDIRHLPLRNTTYSLSLSEASWTSGVSLYHSSSKNHAATDLIPLFSNFQLPAPSNIKISYSFDQELVAIISWDNKVDEQFAPVVKTVIKVERPGGSEARRKRSAEISEVDLTQTKTTFRLAELGWGSRLSLQVRLGDQAGPQTEEVEVFSEKVRADYLSPLTDIQVDAENEKVEISWRNPNTPFPDGSRVPLELRLYKPTDKETPIRTEPITQSDATRTSIPYSTMNLQPWELGFTLGLAGQRVRGVQGLLDTFSLSPPEEMTVECEETCEVSWCLPPGQQHLQGMGTIISLRNESQAVVLTEILEETGHCDNTTLLLSQLPLEAVELTLQSFLPGYRNSSHSQPRPIRDSSVWGFLTEPDNQFWLILGLSILLILYIIGTVLCLRRVRNRGGYAFVDKNADNQAGNFSLCSELNGQPPPASGQSDTGSRDTVQESIISEECSGNMLRRNSSIGNFNEDDEFIMGNFDEDGSFIGDYTETSQEESQAIQNKLLAFANMYKKA